MGSIEKNMDYLVANTNNTEDLLRFLTQKGVLAKAEKEEIAKISDNDKKLTDLYALIGRRGDASLPLLLESLKMSGNWKVAEKLQSSSAPTKEIKIVNDDETDSVLPGVKASRLLFEKSKPKSEEVKAAEEKESKVKNILSMFQSSSISKDESPPPSPKTPKEKFQRVVKAFPAPVPAHVSTTASTAAAPPISKVSFELQSTIVEEHLRQIKETEEWIDSKLTSITEYSEIQETETELPKRVDDLLYRGKELVSKSEMSANDADKSMLTVNNKSGLLWSKLRALKIELGSKQEVFSFYGKDMPQGKDLTAFAGIEKNLEKSLKVIHLRNVTIEGSTFVDNIKYCSNLEEIRLEKVDIRGALKGRATLPQLKLFQIDQIGFKSGNVHDHLQKVNPQEEYLFFNQENDVVWPLEDIWTLGVDIKIVVNGNVVLYLDHEKQEMTSMLKETATMLKNSAGHVSHLAINQSRIQHTDLPTQLSELNLYQCDGLFLSTYLSQCTNLTEISVWGGYDQKTVHLSALPNTLKRAAFAYVNIVNSRTSILQLDEFYSYRCRWLSGETVDGEGGTESNEEIFDNIMAQSKRIAVVGGHSGTKPNPNFLLSLLQAYTEWIFLYDFDWSDSFEEKIAIKEFMGNIGLQGNENGFVVKKVRSGEIEKWTGNEVTKDGKNRFEFGHFKWDQFWNSYETAPGGGD